MKDAGNNGATLWMYFEPIPYIDRILIAGKDYIMPLQFNKPYDDMPHEDPMNPPEEGKDDAFEEMDDGCSSVEIIDIQKRGSENEVDPEPTEDEEDEERKIPATIGCKVKPRRMAVYML